KPDVMVFGDSVMRGVTLDENTNRYVTHRGRFDSVMQRFHVSIENNARFGFTVERGFDQIKKTISKAHHPDIVLLEYGGNDCNFDWKAVSERPAEEHFPVLSPEKFESIYNEMLDYIISIGSLPVIILPPPIDSEKFLDWVCRPGLSKENIISWLGEVSLIYRWQEHYSRICERIAHERDLPMIDLRTQFVISHEYSSLICADGIHPTEKGHGIIDKELYKFADSFAKENE
ncbi:MAG: SGNH/GDSL hydrolase family protein, partial [Eubacteriales bacterium]